MHWSQLLFRNGLFIGVDPGTQKHNLGLAIVDIDGNLRYCSEVLQVNALAPGSMCRDKHSDHLWQLRYRFAATLQKARNLALGSVILAGIENQWVGPNPRVGLLLSKQFGVIFAALAEFGIYSIKIEPTQAKKALTGSGKADKAAMVKAAQYIGMECENDNVADAIGVALAARVKYQEWEIDRMA